MEAKIFWREEFISKNRIVGGKAILRASQWEGRITPKCVISCTMLEDRDAHDIRNCACNFSNEHDHLKCDGVMGV